MAFHDDSSRPPRPGEKPAKPGSAGLGQWYLRRGRIDRRTFWLHYFLPLQIVSLLPLIWLPAGWIWSPPGPPWTWAAVAFYLIPLLLVVPSISSQVTRLHDRGHSAWWLLWCLVPVIGSIVLIVQACMKGEAAPNRYGPPPSRRDPLPGGPSPALVP